MKVDYKDPQSSEADVQHDPYNPYGAGRDLYRREQEAPDGSHEAISGYDRSNDGFDGITKNIDKTRDQEEQAGWRNRVTKRENPVKKVVNGLKTPRFSGMRRKSSLAAILFVLLGGGSVMTLFLSPGLAIVHLKEVLVGDLNDQLAAVDKRSAIIMRSKMKDLTNGSCGVIKIKCRFATMTDKQAEKFRKAGIEIERDMTKGFGSKRGQITKMTFTDRDGNKLEITDAKQLQSALRTNVDFKYAVNIDAFNPKIRTLGDAVMKRVMSNAKTSKANKLEGENKEQLQQSLDDAAAGKATPDAKSLTPRKNDKGEVVGYLDEDGQPYTTAEYEQIKQKAASIEQAGKIGGTGMVGRLSGAAVKGLGALGTASTACSVYTTSRAVAALAKVKRKMELIRFAVALVLTPADMIKAGDATDTLTTFAGDNLTEITQDKEVVDETKWDQAGSANDPPVTKDPDAGKAALDSPGFATAAHGEVPKLNARSQRFMLGGTLGGTLTGINMAIARVVNGGNPDPRQVSQKCRYINNPFVQVGSLAAGIGLGIFSFGLFTGLSVAGSLALAFATPYLESMIADIIAGNVTKGISGIDSGDAAFAGTAGLLGDVAQNRGMKPLDSSEAMSYLALNQQTENEYASLERRQAADTPFDIYNQYSFLGSLARSFIPFTVSSSNSLAAIGLNTGSVFNAAFASITPQTHALTADRFKQCNDPAYEMIGIEADVFCNVRYGMTQQELAMDPLENAEWMAATGNIDPESEDGVAIDNKQDWNYVKFLKECTNRTAGWGEEQDESGGDGGNCRDATKEAQNMHYRVYTMDQGLDKAMDETPDETPAPGTTGFAGGENGPVNSDGWAFPSTADAEVTSGFGMRQGEAHNGVDIAQAGDATGKPIFAARDGKVVAAGPADGFGNWIVIKHTVDGQEIDTLYGHMYDDGVLVRVGDEVKAGQQIGKIGNNGQSFGAHLHFGMWLGDLLSGTGKFVNPEEYDFIKNKKPADIRA